MFIGILFVLTLTGTMQEDAAVFATKAACEDAKTALVAKIVKSDEVLAYNVTCYDAESFLVVKKLTPEERRKGLQKLAPLQGTVNL